MLMPNMPFVLEVPELAAFVSVDQPIDCGPEIVL
jgi:hypothetical protein